MNNDDDFDTRRKARMEAEQSVINNPVKMSKIRHQLEEELAAKAEKKRAKKDAKKAKKDARKDAKKVPSFEFGFVYMLTVLLARAFFVWLIGCFGLLGGFCCLISWLVE